MRLAFVTIADYPPFSTSVAPMSRARRVISHHSSRPTSWRKPGDILNPSAIVASSSDRK